MNAAAFAAMKPGAFFINASRGNLVDEVALLQALNSGRWPVAPSMSAARWISNPPCNWPHPNRNPLPSNQAMLDLLTHWAPDPAVRQKILVDNPAALFGFNQSGKFY